MRRPRRRLRGVGPVDRHRPAVRQQLLHPPRHRPADPRRTASRATTPTRSPPRRALGRAELVGVAALRLDRPWVGAAGPPRAHGAPHGACWARWCGASPARPAHPDRPHRDRRLRRSGSAPRCWSPRPLLFGLVLLALTLLAAEGGLDPRWLLPMFWLWVNTHGSFPLGIVALGLPRRSAAGSTASDRHDRARAPDVGRRSARCLGAVNPLGPRPARVPGRGCSGAGRPPQIIEWQSPSFSVRLGPALPGPGGARHRRPRPAALLPGGHPAGGLHRRGAARRRNVAVASIVLVPGMARGLRRPRIHPGRSSQPDQRGGRAGGGPGGGAARDGQPGRAGLTALRPSRSMPWPGSTRTGCTGGPQPPRRTPSATTSSCSTATEAHAFLDDRVDMYPKPVVDDFLVLLHGSPGWREVLERRDVDLVLWERTLRCPRSWPSPRTGASSTATRG